MRTALYLPQVEHSRAKGRDVGARDVIKVLFSYPVCSRDLLFTCPLCSHYRHPLCLVSVVLDRLTHQKKYSSVKGKTQHPREEARNEVR